MKYSNPGVGFDGHSDGGSGTTSFVNLFHEDDQAVLQEDIRLWNVERPPYREVRMRVKTTRLEVGVRMTLSFHDRSPAVQVTLTDLRTRWRW